MSVESNFAITLVLHCHGLWLAKKISRHILNQSEGKVKPIVTCSHAFSRAWRLLHVFALSSDWFIGLSPSVVIGQSFWFYDTHLKTTLLNNKWYHAKVLPKRFHFNGHVTIGFGPRTQKLELHFMSPLIDSGVKGPSWCYTNQWGPWSMKMLTSRMLRGLGDNQKHSGVENAWYFRPRSLRACHSRACYFTIFEEN